MNRLKTHYWRTGGEFKKGYKHTEEAKRKMKGRKLSDEHKEKINWLGKKHSEKTKQKMRESNPHYWKGKHFSEIARINMGKAHKGSHHSEKTKKKMKESRIKYMTSGKMKYKDTSIEILIEQELIKNKIPYMKQVPIEGIALVDFLLPNKIIIQCDGTYWHNLPNRKNRDINQDFLLSFKGYKVFRFTDIEINKSVEKCIEKITRG